jgi:hypothetical protein
MSPYLKDLNNLIIKFSGLIEAYEDYRLRKVKFSQKYNAQRCN